MSKHLLHNYFFPETSYHLAGFYKYENRLSAVVEQVYVRATSPTDVDMVRSFMSNNGFVNTRNNDYYNDSQGIILEDLHEANVLTNSDTLFFIDTVFYLKEQFWINQEIIKP